MTTFGNSKGFGFEVQSFGAKSLGSRVKGLWFKVEGSRFRV
jgi:hypothetical protein